VGTDELDRKHANERRVREAAFKLKRDTADARRDIDLADDHARYL